MSNQILKPKGCDWLPGGVLCKVWDTELPEEASKEIVVWYDDAAQKYIDKDGYQWDHAEPVAPWKPKEGELVAAWSDSTDRVTLSTYLKSANGYHVVHVSKIGTRGFYCLAPAEGLPMTATVDDIKKRGAWI